MRFLVTIKWHRKSTGEVETYQVMANAIRGDGMRVILDTCEGLEVHFELQCIEAVYLDRKG